MPWCVRGSIGASKGGGRHSRAAGLTISDAFRMMLMRTMAEKALPFDPLVPNAETIEAMKAARRGSS